MSAHALLSFVLVVATPLVGLLVLWLCDHWDHPRSDDLPADQDEAGDGETCEVEHVPLAA